MLAPEAPIAVILAEPRAWSAPALVAHAVQRQRRQWQTCCAQYGDCTPGQFEGSCGAIGNRDESCNGRTGASRRYSAYRRACGGSVRGTTTISCVTILSPTAASVTVALDR